MIKNYIPQITLLLLLCTTSLFAQTARVQIIHNSPDAAASTVDVYVNDALLAQGNDVAFRTASEFFDAPAEVSLSIEVAQGGSTSSADSFYELNTTLTTGETYILVANGIVPGSTGYNPNQPFSLEVYTGARENSSNPSFADILAHHGSTDAPTVDIVETELSAGTLVNDISYPEFDGYFSLPTADYVIEVQSADNTEVFASYGLPVASLNLTGDAVTLIASGFFDPSSNNDGPAFGLFLATTDGGALIALPSTDLPTNDDPDNADDLNCNSTVSGSTENATDSSGSSSGDVFYSYQGIGDFEAITVSTCSANTDFNTSIRVYDSVNLDNEIANNDDFCGEQSEVTFLSNGTKTYYIMVEGSTDQTGNYELSLTCADPETARVQVIHNSPSTTATFVDVYINDALTLDNLEFRTSTAFLDIPAGFDLELAVTLGNNNSSSDAFYTTNVNLDQTETYIIVADGTVVDAPAGEEFSLEVYAGARETSGVSTQTDVLVHHGSPDAPTVDIIETTGDNTILVDDISFPEFQGYLELPTANYELSVTNADNSEEFAAYEAAFSTLEFDGDAVTVLASGYFTPEDGDPSFGLWVTTAAGGPLTELPGAPLSVEQNTLSDHLVLFPNPTVNTLSIRSNELVNNVVIYNATGKVVLHTEVNDKNVDLDTSLLSPGIYFARVSTSQNIRTYKIIKQ